ncbi:hypothetical protein [Gulosibacter macacae]|uniref:hypothetical protein n=1 Tax=Gulosibacter macacae TaxID=2488791 RepID=UPI00163A6A40|nr:hypothetical protein [Gulosibacter macacae]
MSGLTSRANEHERIDQSSVTQCEVERDVAKFSEGMKLRDGCVVGAATVDEQT